MLASRQKEISGWIFGVIACIFLGGGWLFDGTQKQLELQSSQRKHEKESEWLYKVSCLQHRLGRCEGVALTLPNQGADLQGRVQQIAKLLDEVLMTVCNEGVTDSAVKSFSLSFRLIELFEKDLEKDGLDLRRLE